jgi:hypothetical protein
MCTSCPAAQCFAISIQRTSPPLTSAPSVVTECPVINVLLSNAVKIAMLSQDKLNVAP